MASFRLAPIVIAAGLVLLSGPAHALSPNDLAAWRSDLAFVRTQLPKTHANAFHHESRDAFEAALDSLSARAPAMTSQQVMFGLATVIAGIGDGHTRLTLPLDSGIEFFRGHASTPAPKMPGLTVRQYPIRLHWLEDGLYVARADRAHARLAGARVVGIGRLSADSALAVAARSAEHDNDSEARLHAAEWLVLPEALDALGIVDDMERAPYRFELPGGKQIEVPLEPVPLGGKVDWVDARAADRPVPLYLRNTDKHFWFEYLPDSRTVYFAYNQVNDEPDETLEHFSRRLFDFIGSNPVDRLVIDLRHNRGGNNSLNLPLLHGLIRCDEVQEPGALYAIIGRSTFSAAMMFTVDLERHTSVIFVGEPTGARPNGYGDARKVTLPETGLTMRVSTLYWQYSDPRDERPWIAPHIATPLTSGAYREGRDPAMGVILAGVGAKPDPAGPAGTWKGALRFGPEQFDAVFRFRRNGEAWAGEVDLPAADIKASPLHVTAASLTEIDFDVSLGSESSAVSGRLQGERILAVVDYRGRSAAMVLDRSGDTKEP